MSFIFGLTFLYGWFGVSAMSLASRGTVALFWIPLPQLTLGLVRSISGLIKGCILKQKNSITLTKQRMSNKESWRESNHGLFSSSVTSVSQALTLSLSSLPFLSYEFGFTFITSWSQDGCIPPGIASRFQAWHQRKMHKLKLVKSVSFSKAQKPHPVYLFIYWPWLNYMSPLSTRNIGKWILLSTCQLEHVWDYISDKVSECWSWQLLVSTTIF